MESIKLAEISGEILARGMNEQKTTHSHYKKDVSSLNMIDVYRVLKLFNVTDPCEQHAIKKILCAGVRGNKSVEQDIQEAIDTLQRRLQMINEDCNEQPEI